MRENENLEKMYNEWCNLEGDVLGFRNQVSVLSRIFKIFETFSSLSKMSF